MSSSLEILLREQLKALFPHARIHEQYHVKQTGISLFFDFYLPHLELLIECQGEQHYKYVPHFHQHQSNFKSYQMRDRLKREWVSDSGKRLLEIRYNQLPDSPKDLFCMIMEVITDG